MTTESVLRSIAAQALAEADRIGGIPPAIPPAAPPAAPPVAPPVQPPVAGVSTRAFSNQLRQMLVQGQSGQTIAFSFPVTPEAKTSPVKLSVSPSNDGGLGANYQAWISTAPGGPAIGPDIDWQATGGAIDVSVDGGPFWATRKVAPGVYYFNVRNVSGSAPYFASFTGAWPA